MPGYRSYSELLRRMNDEKQDKEVNDAGGITATFGKNFKLIRTAYGYDMKLLSDNFKEYGFEVSANFILDLEKGRASGMSLRRMVKLSNFFSIPLEDMMFLDISTLERYQYLFKKS